MEFAVLFEGQVAYPSRANEQRVLRSGVDHAILADQLGFDRFYVVEHHSLEGYAHSSAPEVLLSYIAAKTERIRIAHGIVCLPFKVNHPVRVAERAAMLDILSGGRLDVGVGRSSSAHEQQVFGITDEETYPQMEAGLRAIVRMWTEDRVEFAQAEDLLEMPLRTIRPQPVQDPHPPLAMACTKDETFLLAGRLGLAAMSNSPDAPEQVARKRSLYDQARAEREPADLVGKFPTDRFSASVFATVLDDRKLARTYGLKGLRYFLQSARRWAPGGSLPDPDSWADDELESALVEMFERMVKPGSGGVGLTGRVPEGTPESIVRSRTAGSGTPRDTIEFVERLQEVGVDEVYFLVSLGGIPDEIAVESIRKIGEHVIPHFRPANRRRPGPRKHSVTA
jgi:alkanesulfonate monooxygenase SsuD/methylene tetrahydromethanopterin reductase-like flavin-dependent oxidoreductase (luciferase family)